MNFRRLVLAITGLASLSLYGCTGAPGRPAPGAIPVDPDEVSAFTALYAQNCAGCHGPDGKGGAAISLSDSVYLSLADDAILRGAATKGIPKTAMPAFAKSEGGMLTDKQIDVIVRGIRERWSKPDVLRGVNPAPYRSPETGLLRALWLSVGEMSRLLQQIVRKRHLGSFPKGFPEQGLL